MQTIEMRLQKLEASNRRYQTILILLIASFTIIFMAFKEPQQVPDTIRAKKMEIVDNNNNVLVQLSQSGGNGIIKTYRSNGKRLLNFTYTTKDEGYIGLDDGNGTEMIRMTSSSEGGGGYIGVYNPAGKRTLTLNNEDMGGNIYVSDKEGNSRVTVQCNSSSGGYLALYNSSGYSAVKLTQTSSGNGDLYVNDKSGIEQVRLSVSSSAGNLQIKNANKTMIVELGGTAGKSGTINTYNSGGTFIQGIGSSN